MWPFFPRAVCKSFTSLFFWNSFTAEQMVTNIRDVTVKKNIVTSWKGFLLVLELRSVGALPCSSTTPLKFLSRCLSAHVIEGPVAIYEAFYISGFIHKILTSFQTPRVLYSLCEYPSICSRGWSFLLIHSTLLNKRNSQCTVVSWATFFFLPQLHDLIMRNYWGLFFSLIC